jgi:hypothetical protein
VPKSTTVTGSGIAGGGGGGGVSGGRGVEMVADGVTLGVSDPVAVGVAVSVAVGVSVTVGVKVTVGGSVTVSVTAGPTCASVTPYNNGCITNVARMMTAPSILNFAVVGILIRRFLLLDRKKITACDQCDMTLKDIADKCNIGMNIL